MTAMNEITIGVLKNYQAKIGRTKYDRVFFKEGCNRLGDLQWTQPRGDCKPLLYQNLPQSFYRVDFSVGINEILQKIQFFVKSSGASYFSPMQSARSAITEPEIDICQLSQITYISNEFRKNRQTARVSIRSLSFYNRLMNRCLGT